MLVALGLADSMPKRPCQLPEKALNTAPDVVDETFHVHTVAHALHVHHVSPQMPGEGSLCVSETAGTTCFHAAWSIRNAISENLAANGAAPKILFSSRSRCKLAALSEDCVISSVGVANLLVAELTNVAASIMN